MTASTLRKVFLVLFVVQWLITDALFWAAGLKIWAILWLVILAAVLVHEIWAKLTGRGKSISTRLGYLIEAKPLLGWAIIGCMFTSWGFLLLHLGVGR